MCVSVDRGAPVERRVPCEKRPGAAHSTMPLRGS